MKQRRRHMMALCCAVFFFTPGRTYAQERPVVDSSYAHTYYRQRLSFFQQMPDEKNEVVFLGNSITEAGAWQELLPGRAVKNRGISGDVTYGVLARLDEVLSSQPARIFLMIGINDLKRGIPPDTIAQTYRRILTKIKTASPKTRLYVQSVLPVNEAMLSASYKKISNALIGQLNHHLLDLAAEFGSTYVDVHPVMKDEQGQLDKTLTSDGIHLWPSAYIRWVNHLKQQGYLK